MKTLTFKKLDSRADVAEKLKEARRLSHAKQAKILRLEAKIEADLKETYALKQEIVKLARENAGVHSALHTSSVQRVDAAAENSRLRAELDKALDSLKCAESQVRNLDSLLDSEHERHKKFVAVLHRERHGAFVAQAKRLNRLVVAGSVLGVLAGAAAALLAVFA